MSVADVAAELVPGGMFEGFRYATAAEVEQMWSNGGLSGFGTESTGTLQGNSDLGTTTNASVVQGMLGYTAPGIPTTTTPTTSAGYIGSPSGVGNYYFAVLTLVPSPNLSWAAGTTSEYTTDGAALPEVGSFLVRP